MKFSGAAPDCHDSVIYKVLGRARIKPKSDETDEKRNKIVPKSFKFTNSSSKNISNKWFVIGINKTKDNKT